MALRLNNYRTFPAGGFYYVQPGYPQKKFTQYDGFLDQARRISTFRIANSLPRSTVTESAEDLEAFTCARVGSSGCYDTEQSFDSLMVGLIPSAGCGSCGTPIT